VKLEEKKQVVENLHARFSKAAVVILTDYKGLDVAAMNALRRKLGQQEVEYHVAKNSLLFRAAEKTDVALIKDRFKGPTAIAISYEDPVAPAKMLSQFAKEHEALEIKSGVMAGKVLEPEDIKALAMLPAREVLLGQLLAVLNGVPTSFVRLLSAVPRQLLNVLVVLKEQKEAA